MCPAAGLAGGTWDAQTLGGDFNATQWAKLGDKGSVVLPCVHVPEHISSYQ